MDVGLNNRNTLGEIAPVNTYSAETALKRQLVLRNYQAIASDYAMNHDVSVLGIAPNGGKTEISIDVISKYLSVFPNSRILILAHSTNVLKDNYLDRLNGLELPFLYSTDFNSNCQVHVCLPQSEHLITGHYDFIIVDEAHENYFAERVQRIIKKINPKKQLMLTGSPAPFIKKGGYNIYSLAINELPEEYFSKLQVELVASNYNWSKNYNSDYELKNSVIFTKTQTKKTLERVLIKLIERVKLRLTPTEFNDPGIIASFKSWVYTYKKLGKTMIVCNSINQAKDVNDILQLNGVNSVVSNSETDKGSLEIQNFKDNKYDVLVVVDRARLGYSDVDLYNIIDMSGSHNPIIIYQILCRVLRGNTDMQKYYLKVTTQEYGMMDLTHACTCAALMLTDHKYLSTFNGSNFNGILIPVIKSLPGSNTGSGGSSSKKTSKIVFPEFTHDIISLFKNIIHNLDNPASIYKLTTIKDVRNALSGKVVLTDEMIWASAKGENIY